MKISYNWLKEILPLEISPEETAVLLTACGLEVENIEIFESVKGGMKGLVIGEVKTCMKHPDADKLSLTTVDAGTGEIYQIVCGAPNVAAGQKVVVALPGIKIFPTEGEPFVIKQAKIRGQVSNGMICAEDEIGIGTSHAGVIVLPDNAKIGTAASEFFQIQNDHVFEIGLTPNRADAASHIGLARDLAAVIRTKNLIESGVDQKIELKTPVSTLNNQHPDRHRETNNKTVAVIVEDLAACPRYSGISISNVKVGESPAWLKNRLLSIGINPINNIVDITNYVLHECGQPLHAFDIDQIAGKKIIVRSAKQNEKFVTLDKVERILSQDDLMICDVEKPMCIAGVYGGLNSGITDNSKNIFIESACFNPSSIRKTSKRHGLKTDASFRFERGTDPEITIYALKRAAALMCEIAGGEIASEISDNYPDKIKPALVNLDFNYIEKFSGERFDKITIRTIIDSLGIKIISESANIFELEVPLFKVDVHRPADVVEEILRVYGYDRIPVPQKINASLPSVIGFDPEELQNKIFGYLSDNGFNEILNNSLTKSEYASLPGWNEKEIVKVLNPLSQELSVMRQDLLASSLETVVYNINRKQNDLKFFEFGKTYRKISGKYKESNHLCLLLTGNVHEPSWKLKESKVDFYLLKSYVSNLLMLCGINDCKISEGTAESFMSSLSYSKNNDVIVQFGQLQKSLLKRFDISQEVFYADVNWDLMVKYAMKKPVRYAEISKFPAVKRDLSMLISKEISYSQLELIAYSSEKKLLREIRLFDIYEGDKIEAGKKSYALSFILQDDHQTLTENQIGKVMEKLMAAFEREAGAVIRRT
jgi:phenylalanyl-tRNA synthetase beta chain